MSGLKDLLAVGGFGAVMVYAVYAVSVIITWPLNLFFLIMCDFDPFDKNEIVHLIGLIPLASPITVWL